MKDLCSFCGETIVYCKSLCRNCYMRKLRNGTPIKIRDSIPKKEKQTYHEKIIASLNPATRKGEKMLSLYKEGKTMQEIGIIFGLTKSRVHQILHGR